MKETIIEKTFSTKIGGRNVEMTVKFDWTNVPNVSMLVLATRALIIDLQRYWRSKYKDDPDKVKEKWHNKTVLVKDLLAERPKAERQRRSKLDRFVVNALALGMTENEIRTIARNKGYDDSAIDKAIAKAKGDDKDDKKADKADESESDNK